MADFLQPEWKDWKCDLDLQSTDLQEILHQFESNNYLKEMKLFDIPPEEAEAVLNSVTVLSHNEKHATDKLDKTFPLSDISSLKRKHDDLDDLKSSKKRCKIDSDGEDDLGGKGELAKRRVSHNTTERRRREKINENIDELRRLLPGAGKGVNKAAVLHQTAERMKSLQNLVVRTMAEKRQLEDVRLEMMDEICRLRAEVAHYQRLLSNHGPDHLYHPPPPSNSAPPSSTSPSSSPSSSSSSPPPAAPPVRPGPPRHLGPPSRRPGPVLPASSSAPPYSYYPTPPPANWHSL